MSSSKKKPLAEIAALFLKLGTIGFGGPPANIAMMERETVYKRKWVSQEYFLDMLAITNLIPGPNAGEMALHLGYARAGLPGLIVAGFFYIFPSFLLSLLLGVLYADYGNIPEIEAIFYGINPLLISIIFSSAFRLSRGIIRSFKEMIAFVLFLVATLLGVNESLVIIFSGIIWVFLNLTFSEKMKFSILFSNLPLEKLKLDLSLPTIPNLFLYFLKTGSLLFGSGLALLALIENDIVNVFQWMSRQQLIDAITVGQITPGPVSSAATFIGYQIAGYPGAIAATIGIFIPSFIIAYITSTWLPKLHKNSVLPNFLKGVTIGVIALIIVVAIRIFQTAVIDFFTLAIAIFGFILLWRFRVETIWLMLFGIGVGLAKFYLF